MEVEKLFCGGDGNNSLYPLIAAMQNNNGLGGNGGLGWLLAILLLSGRGFGFGAGAAAAGIENCQDYLAIINAINGVDKSVATSTGTVVNSVDLSSQRVTSAVTAGFAEQTQNLTNQNNTNREQSAAGFARLDNVLAVLQANTNTGFNNLEKTTTAGFTGVGTTLCGLESRLLSAGSCNTDRLMKSLAESTTILSAQNTGLSEQIGAFKCDVDKQFVAQNCLIKESTGAILGAIKDSNQQIICALNDLKTEIKHGNELAAKDASIAALSAKLEAVEAEKNRNRDVQIVALNNQINQISNFLSGLNRGSSAVVGG